MTVYEIIIQFQQETSESSWDRAAIQAYFAGRLTGEPNQRLVRVVVAEACERLGDKEHALLIALEGI